MLTRTDLHLRPRPLRRTWRATAVAFAVLASVTSVSTAHAQKPGPDPGAADALFREGRKAMQAGNYAVACPKFQESFKLDPAPGTLLNLGDCEEKQGHLVAAWQYFREAETRLGQDERSNLAHQRWQEIEGKLAFVTFKLPPKAPTDTKIVRDDIELTSASVGVALPLDPGMHVVRVRAPGATETRQEIQLKSGERREVLLEIGGASSTPSPKTSDSHGGTTIDTDTVTKPSVLPWVAFGIGGAGLVAMGIGTWQVLDAKSTLGQECSPNNTCSQAGLDAADRGKTFSLIGTVGGVVAVAGIAAGTVLLVTSPSKKTTALGAGPMGTGYGLSATGAF